MSEPRLGVASARMLKMRHPHIRCHSIEEFRSLASLKNGSSSTQTHEFASIDPIKNRTEKPLQRIGFSIEHNQLLDFCFFVFNVLTDFWIKFHDRHFFRSSTLVFSSRVEVTRTCSRFQLDFVAARFRHDGSFILLVRLFRHEHACRLTRHRCRFCR